MFWWGRVHTFSSSISTAMGYNSSLWFWSSMLGGVYRFGRGKGADGPGVGLRVAGSEASADAAAGG